MATYTNSILTTNAAQTEEEKKKKDLLAALGLSEEEKKTEALAAGTAPAAPAVTEKTSGEKMKELQDAILNREGFTYDAEKDPKYASVRKSYLRDSKRATEDAIASAAANTGGVASSYAAYAATQAGDYYASKMNDELSALYNDAYNRYLQEHSLKQNDLSILDAEYERRYQLAMQMANLGDDSYLRALADEYGGKPEGYKPSSGSSSGGSISYPSGGGGYSYTLPEPSDETETDTDAENDITEELPIPDETKQGKPVSGGTVAGDEGNKAPVNPENAANQNAAWENSGLSRDEYDSSARENAEKNAKRNTPASLSDFNSSADAMIALDEFLNKYAGNNYAGNIVIPNIIEQRDWQSYRDQYEKNGTLSLPASLSESKKAELRAAIVYNKSYDEYLNSIIVGSGLTVGDIEDYKAAKNAGNWYSSSQNTSSSSSPASSSSKAPNKINNIKAEVK